MRSVVEYLSKIEFSVESAEGIVSKTADEFGLVKVYMVTEVGKIKRFIDTAKNVIKALEKKRLSKTARKQLQEISKSAVYLTIEYDEDADELKVELGTAFTTFFAQLGKLFLEDVQRLLKENGVEEYIEFDEALIRELSDMEIIRSKRNMAKMNEIAMKYGIIAPLQSEWNEFASLVEIVKVLDSENFIERLKRMYKNVNWFLYGCPVTVSSKGFRVLPFTEYMFCSVIRSEVINWILERMEAIR